mmetsp:Transcript_22268/g.27296  ORF Transcript_22268/g.27296 Transcript_22268/m.27296 type:complete len:121 (+) Transcript_22268:79-441(+)
MLSITRVAISSRALSMAPKFCAAAAASNGSFRMMSLEADLNKKEKVEEDRYIRQKEHELYLARKAKADAEAASRELSEVEVVAKKIHDDTVSEVFGVLSKTGDKVSDACVENIANWKIGN